MICMKIIFGEAGVGTLDVCAVRKLLSICQTELLALGFFHNDFNCECQMFLTSVLGPAWVYDYVMKLLMVVIWKGGACFGLLCWPNTDKILGFCIWGACWVLGNQRFVISVLSLTFKGVGWAQSHTDSFLRPERHSSQDSLLFVGKRVTRIFVLLFETFCFRLCLCHIL